MRHFATLCDTFLCDIFKKNVLYFWYNRKWSAKLTHPVIIAKNGLFVFSLLNSFGGCVKTPVFLCGLEKKYLASLIRKKALGAIPKIRNH